MKKTASQIADYVLWKCAADPVSESAPWAGQNAPDAAPQSKPTPKPKLNLDAGVKNKAGQTIRYTPDEKTKLKKGPPYSGPGSEYYEQLSGGTSPEAKWGGRLGPRGRIWTVGSEGRKRYRDARTFTQKAKQDSRENLLRDNLKKIRPVTYDAQFAPETGPTSRVGGHWKGLLRKKDEPR